MVQLTDAIIKGKTRCEKLEDVKNLNLWGQDITDVSILQRTPNMEVLSLSVNGITSLKHFMHCTALRELYLRKNMVTELSDIRFLMPLPHLKVLWLSDNPCAEAPDYRSFVIAQLPSLEKLDNLDIMQEERKSAQHIPRLQPATPEELLADDDPTTAGSTAATTAYVQQQSRPSSPAGATRPLTPAGTTSVAADAPSSTTPYSRQRVPGSAAAVSGSTTCNPAAATGSGFANLSNFAAYDRESGATATAAAAGSFAFFHHQQDASSTANCQLWQQLQQQQHQVKASYSACDCPQAEPSPNVLYAVMALLADLDASGLSIVQKEVQQRLKNLQG